MLLRILLGVIETISAALEIVFTTISGILAIIRVRLHREWEYKRWLKRDLADCETILELGCGSNSPILQIGYGQRTTAVDIFEPYIKKHNQNNDYKICYQANILDMPFPEKQFDAVVMFDVLEHLDTTKVKEIALFTKMERAAIKKVIMFTPNGFVENDEVDGDPYQRHVSAWEPETYLSRGYSVRGATGWRKILGKASLPKYHPYSIFSIIAMISQPLIFNSPKTAWHSYAVKELK